MEIYNEAVRDLLSSDGSPLRLLDDPERGTIVDRLTEETLRDLDHLKELLSVCEAQRQIGETSMNEMSSRSHQILRLAIESSTRQFLGKENFSSLFSHERASQALSAGTRLKEGCHINRSLLTLGTVIRKLSKGRNGHVPYRDSKLTRILQSSLGGNARTAIICTMSPARSHIEQSRNTLLFATCAKEVATSAKVNVVMSDKALVKHLQKELARLESELRMEKEIKELIEQRDLAQSRLDGLLQASREWEKKTVRDVCLQPVISPSESPSRWPIEFAKKQQEIIELWHACNVSLIHRTYFFLLFKGDPADSFYIEVEQRRLSFLKNTFSQGDLNRTSPEDGQKITLASSIRNLRREREMLCRQMQKRMSAIEREELYSKWGISLQSKRRRMQLAKQLWSETKDMEHVKESASIVAKLIGLLEPEHAAEGDVGLSFHAAVSSSEILQLEKWNVFHQISRNIDSVVKVKSQ
ncbi:hypothetical protein J5N97_025373 [Dioscorea zingiberensis]|uniref:Kinesin motor domain-containing protein n=1 Tax=Dioscorea zingiberensis TaxID=325984 RepID=A0A9D5C849_9LILI|nr:hypothetical protein J5N97_025373 [Dioscorea zingiberensis]